MFRFTELTVSMKTLAKDDELVLKLRWARRWRYLTGLVFALVMVLITLASVAAQAPEPTATPTPSPDSTPTPTPTPSPTPEPTISPEQAAVAEAERKLAEIREEQEKVKKLLGETQQKKASLVTEIGYQDNRIRLTTLKIEETVEKIAGLRQQISELEVKIGRLEKVIKELQTAARTRITATYKSAVGGADPIFLIFSADSFGDFISRYKYLRALQRHDKKLLKQVESTRDNYDEQRELKAAKQTEAEQLEAQLETQKGQLGLQKREKERLLDVTRGEEKQYQEKLEALIADEKAIAEALKDILSRILEGLVSGQSVSRGQVVGRQGNTGNVFPRPSSSCSECGSHLHFMVLTCAEWECAVDPEPYLGKGEYARPLTTWSVTQRFGPATCSYCGYAFHNGLDLVYDGEGYGDAGHGAPIYAIADGEMFYGTDSAGGKYAIIKHADDLYSAYWHLQ